MCIHYWIIDNKFYGKCKLCGKEKQFIKPTQEKLDISIHISKKPKDLDGFYIEDIDVYL